MRLLMDQHWLTTWFFLAILVGGVWSAQPYQEMTEEEIYRFIFDDADVDYIIRNDRICNVYLRCFYSEGPCSNLASAIKSKITEVMSTVCGKCTHKQKQIYKHILEIFIPRRPTDWEKLLSIYDPEGKYWPNVKKFMETPLPDEE